MSIDETVLRKVIKERVLESMPFLRVNTVAKCAEYVDGAPFSVFDEDARKDLGSCFFSLIEPPYAEITGQKIPNIFSSTLGEE